jgi:serine/threonine protein kinase
MSHTVDFWNCSPPTRAVTHLAVEPVPPASLARALAEMAQEWRSGQGPLVEDFLARYPELATITAALKLIHEEFCLRLQHGIPAEPEDFFVRFPDLRDELEVLLGGELTRIDTRTIDLEMPIVGETLGDFELLTELGRGAEGCVFLARQTTLGGRPVVLKITPRRGQEHLSLARLQHTNIVPLYGAQHAGNDHRILIMPYFGGATLARVLEVLRPIPLSERTGQHLLDVLDQADTRLPIHSPAQGPYRTLLARASYVQSICWIGVALADALQYAHQRALVHLDVKPSNVLLANDGQPMLLDFHLACPPVDTGVALPPFIGGTPLYMPPEQHDAMSDACLGRLPRKPIDGRADQFTLAVTLYESLGGELPFKPGISLPLHVRNPQVSRGLSDLMGRALASEAMDRYPDAASFAADLRRHIADQPLTGVPNRSLHERWQKWRRRKPHSVGRVIMLLAVLGAALAVALSVGLHLGQQHQLAKSALVEGREHLREGRPGQAAQVFEHGLQLIEDIPFTSSLRDELTEQAREGRAALAAQQREQLAAELHGLVERIRFLHGSDRLPPQVDSVIARCADLWQRREQVLEQLGNRDDVRRDLLDVALLYADLSVRRAPSSESSQARRAALPLLDEAEQLLGSSHILYREREQYAAALGLDETALQAASMAERTPPETAWENYTLGRLLLRRQSAMAGLAGAGPACAAPLPALNAVAADAVLAQAVKLDPGGLWPNFARGQSSYLLGNHAEAVSAFSVCIGAAPKQAVCHFNRALARAALGQESAALADFVEARRLDANLISREAAVWFNLARWYRERDTKQAQRCLARALVCDPQHGASREMLPGFR